jgi:hypothetical protein
VKADLSGCRRVGDSGSKTPDREPGGDHPSSELRERGNG